MFCPAIVPVYNNKKIIFRMRTFFSFATLPEVPKSAAAIADQQILETQVCMFSTFFGETYAYRQFPLSLLRCLR